MKTLTQFKTSTKMCEQHCDDCDCALNGANRSRTASCASTTGNSLNNSMISNSGVSVGGGVYSSVLNTTIAAPTRESSAPFSPPQLRKTSSDGVYDTNNTSTSNISTGNNTANTTSNTVTGSAVYGIDTEVEQLLRQQEQRDKAEYLRKVKLLFLCMHVGVLVCLRLPPCVMFIATVFPSLLLSSLDHKVCTWRLI